jgi:hypothetical protein
VASYEQGDEGEDRRGVESSGYLILALVDNARIQVVVELLSVSAATGFRTRTTPRADPVSLVDPLPGRPQTIRLREWRASSALGWS